MPYIEQGRRKQFDSSIDDLIDKADRIGQLNYIIVRIADGYIEKFADGEGIDYGACNAIIGMLECAKLEFARKRLYPLEDVKCKENGEVFE